MFCLEESCATQHPYENSQGPLWYTDDFTENTFFTEWKKSKTPMEAKTPNGIYLPVVQVKEN